MIKKFFLLYLLVKGTVLSLKKTDLCFRTEQNECERNNQECMKYVCPELFRFKCGTRTCTLDQHSCLNYMRIEDSLKGIKLPHMISGSLYEKRTRIYRSFISSIEQCPVDLTKTKAFDSKKMCATGLV